MAQGGPLKNFAGGIAMKRLIDAFSSFVFLISLAVSKMAETVSLLKESNFAGRVIVGGAAITQESADDIGADAFAADAWEALRQVRALARGAEA